MIPGIGLLSSIAKAQISVPVVVLAVGGFLLWGYHKVAVSSAVRHAIVEAQRVADVQRAKEKSAAESRLAELEQQNIKDTEALTAANSEKKDALARAIEAESRLANVQPEIKTVRVPHVTTLTCQKTQDAKPQTLTCPPPPVCKPVRRRSCLDERIPDSVSKQLFRR